MGSQRVGHDYAQRRRVLFFIFFKETSYSFIVDASIYISAESSLFPTSSPALVIFCLLIIAFLTSVFFIFISLNK